MKCFLLHKKILAGINRITGKGDPQFKQRREIAFRNDMGKVHLTPFQQRQLGHRQLSRRVGGLTDAQGDESLIQSQRDALILV